MVGVQLPNTVEIAVAFLAIVRIGAIVAPFPVQYRAWELTHLSNVAQARLFITAGRTGGGRRPNRSPGCASRSRRCGRRPRSGSSGLTCRTACWGSTRPSRRPTTGAGWPPALLTTLLNHEALLAQTDISSLRMLGSGSMPLAPSLLQGWHDQYGIEIINFYGSNEGIALLGTPKDIPDPAVRALYFPRYGARPWSISMARTTLARIVDPATGAEITEAGVPASCASRGPACFPGTCRPAACPTRSTRTAT